MKNKIFFCLSTLFISFSTLQALKNESIFNINRQSEHKILINNRILARVNAKPISTYDLMKKMDLAFFRQYPEYASSVEARYQFYELSWKPALNEMIDKELILADAEESKIDVSSGDIRQEIELAFGPNIIVNLDKAGISFDEATKMMREEILIRRLLGGRVHAKALRCVTPRKVKLAYEMFIENPANVRRTEWSYRVITINERTLQRGQKAAEAAYQLLMKGVAPDELASQLKQNNILGRKGKITLSKVMKHHDKEISQKYLEILAPLDQGMYSQPFAVKSRANNATVHRILSVEGKIAGGVPSYQEMEAILKEKLLDEEIDQQTDLYLIKLREHYHIRQPDLDAFLPDDYHPFTLS